MSNLLASQTREVRSQQRGSRIIACLIDGTGTASVVPGSGAEVSLTDSGTGDYLLTLANPLKNVLSVHATPIGASGDVVATIGTVSASAIQILCWDGTDGTTAKDADVYVTIIGSDAESLI